jgi:hypothetical protein
MKIKDKPYVITENVTGFYGCEIPKGTQVFPLYLSDKATRHNGQNHYRFVFDTVKGSKSHGIDGNKRIAIWAINGKLDEIVK